MKKLYFVTLLIVLGFTPLLAQVSFPPPPINLDNFKFLSGVVYIETWRLYGFWPPGPGPFTESPEFPAPASVLYTVNVSNDTNQDMEPSVVSLTLGSTDYTTTAYIKYVNGIAKNHFATTTDFVNFTRGQLSIPAGYTWSADPMLDANIFTSGIAPGRVYCAGIVYNQYPISPPNAIAVWRSNNGGITWSQPTLAAVNNSSNYFLDKPDIVVSWHSGSLGYVYVIYTLYNNSDPNQNQILVRRSTNGGLSFTAPFAVTSGSVSMSQIVVSPWTGYVYALWVDFSANQIKMSRSTNYGQSWSPPETAASGNMAESTFTINGGVRAATVPMARFNSVANRICLVWHEREQPGSNLTDIYYTSKSPSGWQTKVRINDVQTNDQFMPALDFDETGDLKVTFYDRRDDSNNLKYHLYIAHIDQIGNNLQPNERASTFQSDPTQYANRFIGDYQDLWLWTFLSGDKYNAAWVGIPLTIGDIYLTGIQP